MNEEPRFGKNYWIAILLSLVILLAYPYLLKKFFPQASRPVPARQAITAENPAKPAERTILPAAIPEAAIEKPIEPALVAYENELFKLEFSTLGGTLTRLIYKGDPEHAEAGRYSFFDLAPTQAGFLGIKFQNETEDLSRSIFTYRGMREKEGVFEFVYEYANEYRLTKIFTVRRNLPVIELNITLENLAARERHYPLELTYGLEYDPKDKNLEMATEAVASGQKMTSENVGTVTKKGMSAPDLFWAGVLSKYYALLVKPSLKAVGATYKTQENRLEGVLKLEPMKVASQSKAEQGFFIYAGPKRYETLKNFNDGFESILSRGFFGMFKIWLLIALKFFFGYIHNYGWAIIIMTCLLKLAFTPLTHMSFESMKKMQAIQPKVKSLQEKYKKDPARLNKEMMELYKRNKVNPMGGCLPMLLQIPIFIAFYQVLNDAIELKGAGFIGWIHDLSAPDKLFMLPFNLPFLGDSFNLLPIFMIISMVWQQKLTPQVGGTPEQAKMMEFMPWIFGVFFYQMPSGLVLYWFVNNVLSILHQIFVKRMVVVLHHEDAE